MKDVESTQQAIRIIESFENLPIEKRLAIVRDLSPRARQELLESVTRPGEIVRKISPEEMFFTIKELGEENALDLIAMTTGKQLIYLLDVDLWRDDTLAEGSISRWFTIIAAIGEQKMLQLIQTADPELIVSALSRLVTVKVRDPDIDLVEDADSLPTFTLEGMFYVDFRSSQHEDVLKSLFDVIFRWNSHYYHGLMQELAWGAEPENEEMARKWRRARLSEMGFPEFEEAREIYQYLKRSQVSDPIPEPLHEFIEESGEVRPFLNYPLKVLDSETLFRSCLNDVDDPAERDRLAGELAHLANKVVIADGKDPGSLEDLTGSLRKVSGYVNIALEEMSGNDREQAAGLLRSNHLEILFRRAFSLILDLRREAQSLVREHDGVVENLGHPLAGLLGGLFRERPFYAAHVLGTDAARDFQYLEDLGTIKKMMDGATAEDRWENI